MRQACVGLGEFAARTQRLEYLDGRLCVAQVFGLAAGRLAVEHAKQAQIDAFMLTVAGGTPQCQRLLP